MNNTHSTTDKVIVRMPPSPTGPLHLGTARTALFNWLFKNKHNGQMIFRWEDTDKERSKTEFETAILDGLKWIGMDFMATSTFYRQTENLETHKEYRQKLWEAEKIFPCFTTKESINDMREAANKARTGFVFWSPDRDLSADEANKKIDSGEHHVWRFKTPKDFVIQFTDDIRGDIEVNARTIGDFAVARGDGSVLYMLANVVDDATQGITHVIRGEDHVSNTPKQVLLYAALGFATPTFAHIPLVLDKNRKKLSKRNVDPTVCVLMPDFQKAGFLPEAVVNGLAFLGWNPGTTEEIFSLEELCNVFSLEKVNAAAAQYDFDKMLWFNAQWMRKLPAEKIQNYYQEFSGKNIEVEAIAVARQKAKTLVGLTAELEYLITDPGFDADIFLHKKMCPTHADAKKILSEILPMLEQVDEANFLAAKIKEVSVAKIAELGLKNGQFLWPFRAALSNRPGSAGPFDIPAVIGKNETVKRIKRAIESL